MTNKLKTYLEWRFRISNHNKYQKYRDEWISNVTPTQLQYFEIEMNHLINNGVL